MVLTSRPSTAHSPIRRILGIATYISYPCVQQSFVAKVFPVHVLDTPEASRCQRSLLCAFRDVHGLCGLVGSEAHSCRAEGPEEALEDGRHGERAEKSKEEDSELGFWLQDCGCRSDRMRRRRRTNYMVGRKSSDLS